MPLNVEIKARCSNLAMAENILKTQQPRFAGEDHQIDTYFKVAEGRLKLREGNVENALIFYRRSNTAEAKISEVTLYPHNGHRALKEILSATHGVLIEVDKLRRIYFIDNVKFHFDKVAGLGSFVEIEAIDQDGSRGVQQLHAQCAHYRQLLQIKEADLLPDSYSDMLLAKKYPSRN